MSDALDHSGPADDDLLAAELALGVLSGAERAAAEARAAREPAFARIVAHWEERLAPWASEIEEVAPPLQVWQTIAAALPLVPQRTSVWQSLALWRSLTVAAGVLAACCVGAIVYLGTLPAQPPLVAALDGGGHHHFVATLDARRATVMVIPAAYSADPTRVPELWLIPADGKPRALGLLRADQSVTLTLSSGLAQLARANALLAVSLEPPGGSTTGLPTGPVVASGKLTTL